MISDDEIITKPLDTSFLHGMTRDSILKLGADLGYRVNERNFTVAELLEWVKTYEATLSGTAACPTPVGALVYNGEEIPVRDGAAAQGPAGHPARQQRGHARLADHGRLSPAQIALE